MPRATAVLLLSTVAAVLSAPAVSAQIKPHEAKPIRPHVATELSPPTTSPRPAGTPASPQVAAADFLGVWQLVVEGAVRTDENVASGTRTTTSSAGALGRRLLIRADGSYQWGEQKGRWRTTGEDPKTGWPLVLLKADGGKDWKVGWDTRRQARAGDILVWDGFVWQVGRPLR